MAKYINKRFMYKGLYLHIGIVDLFVRGGSKEGRMTYPIISLDLLIGSRRIGILFTIPIVAVTIGYVCAKKSPLTNRGQSQQELQQKSKHQS